MRRASAPLARAIALLWLLCALAIALPVAAQPRVWLDRNQIALDDTVTLTMEVDARSTSAMPNLIDLTRDFRIVDQGMEQNMAMVNGDVSLTVTMRLVLSPLRQGTIEIPSLWSGRNATAPLRLVVLPPRNPVVVDEPPAAASAPGRPIFIEAKVDTATPYVQQNVGYTVRLFYESGLLIDGRLDQEPPDGASLQKIGDDAQRMVSLGGHDYNMVERRYLLIPERSGAMTVPAPHFVGRGMGLFSSDRQDLDIAGAAHALQVAPIPANAPQPWLPLRGLRMRYVETPQSMQVGKSGAVTVEVVADGGTGAQMPALTMQADNDAQVFPDPADVDDRFQQDHPQATIVRRFSILPTREGTLRIVAPRITWWDTQAGVARTASLPDITLRVAPGAPGTAPPPDSAGAGTDVKDDAAGGWRDWLPDGRWEWAALALALLWSGALLLGWRLWSRRARAATAASGQGGQPAASSAIDPQALAKALSRGDLGAIVQALCRAATPVAADLDAVRSRLADPAQRAAVDALQRTRWSGTGDNAATLAALRAAFAAGPRWRTPAARTDAVLLPPLYPER